MKRRSFLAAVGASTAAVALWPRLIREAFADASVDVPRTRQSAPGQPAPHRHIDPSLRPQLVIVVPAADEQKYRRGELWGAYLNHGEPAQIAPLSQVDVSCATMQELGWLAGDVKGEPLALLFLRDGSLRVLDATLPQRESAMREVAAGIRDFAKIRQLEDAVVDERIALVAAMVERALPQIAPGEVGAAAARVVAAVRRQPPAGSHWATSGCGVVVENMKDDTGVAACGAGHVPKKSARFLYFFSKTPRQLRRDREEQREPKAKEKKRRTFEERRRR